MGAAIDRQRWQVELFFNSIKQNLGNLRVLLEAVRSTGA
jgi:IS4 transposase